jgi:tetratricopeptide (TPR) repeat protein
MGAGGFLLAIVVCAYPAMLIRFAITQSFLSALNPLGALSLITAIGLPYGLLMAFLLIMVSSMAVLQGIVGTAVPSLSYLLQAVLSNYYTVVIFHLMGYMLFQYQTQLGYSARIEDEDDSRPDMERLTARLDVLLKEGNYEQLVAGYHQAFKQFPQEASFYDRYFDFLCACKKPALMKEFGGIYLKFWMNKKRFDKLTVIFKQIQFLVPDFAPVEPELRVQLAQQLHYQGDNKQAIKLLNGMHKLYPEFTGLDEAYSLLAKALEQTPGMQAQAEKCLAWVEQFKRKQLAQILEKQVQAQKKEQSKVQAKAADVMQVDVQKPTTKSGLVLELVPIEK